MVQSSDVRFVSNKIDNSRVAPYIDESEQLDIKNQIGESLFIDLLDYVGADDKTGFANYNLFLYGGTYEYETNQGTRAKKQIKGLIHALNYFVWARLIKNNNFTATSFGLVQKITDNSEPVSFKERNDVYGDALDIAQKYLGECIIYLKIHAKDFPLFKREYKKSTFDFKIIRG